MTTDVAADHLSAHLEPRRGGPLARAWRFVAGAVLTLVSGDPFSGPATLELVFRRIPSGAVVARTLADVMEPETLLEQARADLATMTVSEFLASWGHDT